MYTTDWMLDFINVQILLLLEANDVDSLADKDFTDPVNEFILPGLLPPPAPRLRVTRGLRPGHAGLADR